MIKKIGDPAASLMVAWTTVSSMSDAEKMAEAIIGNGAAACVQIEGPITAVYAWKGQVEKASEFRLTFKFPVSQLDRLRNEVMTRHPYETPQWVCVRAEDVAEGYLRWAVESCRMVL